MSLLTLPVFSQMDEAMIDPNWPINQTKTIEGSDVTRILGENDISVLTNVGYRSYEACIERIKRRSEEEMWTNEKKEMMLRGTEKYNRGGSILLYIERVTIAAGNFKYFTIVVRDSADTEIYREELKSDIPETPRRPRDLWSNYTSVLLPKQVSGKLNVYVIDAIGETKKYHFKVRVP